MTHFPMLASVLPAASSSEAAAQTAQLVAQTAEHAAGWLHYLPIASTAISAAFLMALAIRAIPRNWPPHLLWWAIGVFFYGVGTGLESYITLFGNTPMLNRLWYVAGALLGGYPLATGTVYLLLKRKTAHILTSLSLVVVVFTAGAVMAAPLNLENLVAQKPGGDVIGLIWVRAMTPFINIYAALFLIGGAFYSAYNFAFPAIEEREGSRYPAKRDSMKAIGTFVIAVGAILPGIGGSMAKAGTVEALYIGELVGIILIWIGYEFCTRKPAAA